MLPITVLSIVLLFIVTARPVEFNSPSFVSAICKIILFAALISKFVVESNLAMPIPDTFNCPPTYKSSAMPTPPATVSAPVVVLVAAVVDVNAAEPNSPVGFSTVIVP